MKSKSKFSAHAQQSFHFKKFQGASTVSKAKTKEKYEEIFFCKVFVSKLKNALFWGSTNFFSVLVLQTVDAQMLFWSIFLKCTKKC